jgi:hypothetical protein
MLWETQALQRIEKQMGELADKAVSDAAERHERTALQ